MGKQSYSIFNILASFFYHVLYFCYHTLILSFCSILPLSPRLFFFAFSFHLLSGLFRFSCLFWFFFIISRSSSWFYSSPNFSVLFFGSYLLILFIFMLLLIFSRLCAFFRVSFFTPLPIFHLSRSSSCIVVLLTTSFFSWYLSLFSFCCNHLSSTGQQVVASYFLSSKQLSVRIHNLHLLMAHTLL